MTDLFWLMAVTLGPVILAGAIIYALMRQRRLRPDEQRRSDAAARELYQQDENADTRHLGGRS
ncbi:hypothetical protein ASE36_16770 [Rhizobium sp. Root274]|uniref:hypothetical protein n=1 Tax=unclassified Rhizobium TaxID=2613769 RepID=UPI0007123474|nr:MULTISPECIES: hypothetical protein [unclassified Rhizobium]KQW28096.1 hypothetical protein ASC71_16805 [Rhizobium sp. Root1240]KRD28381.1 hypothetical protein ASE36_16770 [Rhizobium sp. Root274]